MQMKVTLPRGDDDYHIVGTGASKQNSRTSLAFAYRNLYRQACSCITSGQAQETAGGSGGLAVSETTAGDTG